MTAQALSCQPAKPATRFEDRALWMVDSRQHAVDPTTMEFQAWIANVQIYHFRSLPDRFVELPEHRRWLLCSIPQTRFLKKQQNSHNHKPGSTIVPPRLVAVELLQ